MKIILNGKEAIFKDNITIYDMMNLKGFDPHSLVVEYNYELIKKDEWDKIILKENDRVEVLRFVGGG